MSSSVTSPCTSPHASDLPDQFTIKFTRDELSIALRWCERFAPADGGEYVSVVELTKTKRRWTFVEEHVMGYYVNSESSPCIGVIPVTHTLLSVATESTQNDTIAVEFNIVLGVYRLFLDDTVIELAMPREWSLDTRFTVAKPSTLVAKPSELVAMGRALLSSHRLHAMPDDVQTSPFVTCDIDNGVLHAQRSWQRWGGPSMSISFPVNGVYSGSFSFPSPIVAREMYYVDLYCETSVSIDVATVGNPVVKVYGPRCGFMFITSEEYVHDVRQSILDAVTDVSCDLDVVVGSEWDSFVRVSWQLQDVLISIMPNSDKVAEYVRVSHCVADGINWNIALAEEVNSWNSALVNTKLVRDGSQLLVVTDIAVDNVSSLPAAIDDVVAKSRKVNDFIAIFQ